MRPAAAREDPARPLRQDNVVIDSQKANDLSSRRLGRPTSARPWPGRFSWLLARRCFPRASSSLAPAAGAPARPIRLSRSRKPAMVAPGLPEAGTAHWVEQRAWAVAAEAFCSSSCPPCGKRPCRQCRQHLIPRISKSRRPMDRSPPWERPRSTRRQVRSGRECPCQVEIGRLFATVLVEGADQEGGSSCRRVITHEPESRKGKFSIGSDMIVAEASNTRGSRKCAFSTKNCLRVTASQEFGATPGDTFFLSLCVVRL